MRYRLATDRPAVSAHPSRYAGSHLNEQIVESIKELACRHVV